MKDLHVTKLKANIENELKKKTRKAPIGQGFEKKTTKSARYAWREEHTADKSYIKEILPMFQQSMESYFKSNHCEYRVTVPSVLCDEGTQPHIQAPHLDFDPTRIRQCSEVSELQPVVVLYAIEEFTLVVFLKGANTFGATIGTRIRVPKGCAIIMAGDLYHSGDVFYDSNNMRLHGYCIPIDITFQVFDIDRTYREERHDITKMPMIYVSNMGMDSGNDNMMFMRLSEIINLRSCGDVMTRKELAIMLYLALYDYIQLSGSLPSPKTDNVINKERFWIDSMYYQVVDECMKDINEEGHRFCAWI
jgi:hypothetical protein